MKKILKRAARRLLGSGIVRESTADLASSEEVQALLRAFYLVMKDLPQGHRPQFSDVGFHKYSQFEEDGLLLYIFSIIGTTNRKVVELCAGNGIECMAANLIVNHGWEGYLYDGDVQKVADGKSFFHRRSQLTLRQPVYRQAWLTAENVNTVVGGDVTGEVDLLSIDVDGMDYWLWQALDCIRPRVCIVEAANYIPSDISVTVRYEADSVYDGADELHAYYRGASLAAMTRLAKAKGMRLVGSNQQGFNCIFLRNDIGGNYFPEVTVASCHANAMSQAAQASLWPKLRHLDWQEVSP
jgi:hypothetical protein